MTELNIHIKLDDEIDSIGESIIENIILDYLLKHSYNVTEVKSI